MRVALAAYFALAAVRFTYPPGVPADVIACLEQCSVGCGVEAGRPTTNADVACLRRALVGAPAECPQ